jgi:hypothetical protein
MHESLRLNFVLVHPYKYGEVSERLRDAGKQNSSVLG